MSCLDFTHFQKVHGEWSDKTFGKRNPVAPLHHLKKEVEEVIKEPFDIEEYADCLLLLMDSARIAGFNMDDLYFAAHRKFAKNKQRKWGKPDENGVVEHIRNAEENNRYWRNGGHNGPTGHGDICYSDTDPGL